jgi:hypothetical protein
MSPLSQLSIYFNCGLEEYKINPKALIAKGLRLFYIGVVYGIATDKNLIKSSQSCTYLDSLDDATAKRIDQICCCVIQGTKVSTLWLLLMMFLLVAKP